MEWHLWAVEDAQELGLVGVQACERTVEGEEASAGGEDLIEAQTSSLRRRRVGRCR